MPTRQKGCFTIAVLLIAMAAQANVIYKEDFSGPETAALNGTVPGTRPGTETWKAKLNDPLAATDSRADGSFKGGDASVSGHLPITLEGGKTYTLTAKLKVVSPLNDKTIPSTQWAAVGFNTQGVVDSPITANSDFAMLLIRRNGAAQVLTRGASGSPTFNVATGTYDLTQPVELKIVLDTSVAPWMADFLINGDSITKDRMVRSTVAAGPAFITIGRFASGEAVFTNLELTEAAAESGGQPPVTEPELRKQVIDTPKNFIYQDDFSGLASAGLGGAAPDTRPGTETWTADAGYKADGSFQATASNLSAYLPFTPEAGKQYRLSVRVSNLQNAGNSLRWAGIGFGNDRLAAGNAVNQGGGGLTALILRQNGDVAAYYNGANTVASDTGYGPAEMLTTVLTTAGYNGAASWSADYYVGEKKIGSHEWETAPMITCVALSVNNSGSMTGSFDDFSLTVIPDLVAIGIPGLGALGTLRDAGAENVSINRKSSTLRIMPLGDSITAGFTDNPDWTHPFEFGFRSGLYTRLKNAGYDFVFVGSSKEPFTKPERFGDPTHGGTVSPTLDLQALNQNGHHGHAGFGITGIQGYAARWISQEKPDIILLLIGINGISTNSPQQLDSLVRTIYDTDKDIALIVAQITPSGSYNQNIFDYNTFIRETLVPKYAAEGYTISTVDQYKHFLTDPQDPRSIDAARLSNGRNHPSNPLYEEMAESWFEGIELIRNKRKTDSQNH